MSEDDHTVLTALGGPWLPLPCWSRYASHIVTRGQRIGEQSLLADLTLALACLRPVLAQVCVQADLRRCLTCWVLWAVECSFISYKNLLPTLKHRYLGSAEESGLLAWYWQRCVETLRGSIDRCLPLSNPMFARLCLLLKSPDLIVSIN
jgi:hypothetical protein